MTRYTLEFAFVGIVILSLCGMSLVISYRGRQIAKNKRVIDELYQRSEDRWSGKDMRQWLAEFEHLNPGVVMPKR